MKFYLLSPNNVPPNPVLFPNMVDTFIEQGHEIVDRIENSDCVLFDLHVRLSGYEQSDIDWIVSHKVPTALFCEYDRGLMSKEIYPNPLTEQQRQIFNLIDNDEIKNVHFCRLMDKTQTYSYNIYPYEKPISYSETLLTADDLFNREYDVVFIANQSPSRDRIAEALRSDGRLNCFISIGAEKLPFEEFLRIHKLGKLFIASGAGGFTCERKQCLFSVSGLIQERTNQVIMHRHTHLENCLKINNPPTKSDLDTIYSIVNNKEMLYNIYENNVNFMHQFYSPQYIANSILKKINKHLS